MRVLMSDKWQQHHLQHLQQLICALSCVTEETTRPAARRSRRRYIAEPQPTQQEDGNQPLISNLRAAGTACGAYLTHILPTAAHHGFEPDVPADVQVDDSPHRRLDRLHGAGDDDDETGFASNQQNGIEQNQ